jgi:hypothetical protein
MISSGEGFLRTLLTCEFRFEDLNLRVFTKPSHLIVFASFSHHLRVATVVNKFLARKHIEVQLANCN